MVLKVNFLFYRTGVAGSSKTRCSYRVNSLCYSCIFVSSGGRLVVMLRVELGTMGLHMWKG